MDGKVYKWFINHEREMILEFLKSKKIDDYFTFKDGNGYSLFSIAVTSGDFEIINEMISLDFDINSSDINGKTPLHYVGERNYLDVARLLLQNGANINAININGNQPLWYAVFNACCSKMNKLALVELFMKNGGNPHHKNNSNNSPLDFAIKTQDYNVIEILENNNC